MKNPKSVVLSFFVFVAIMFTSQGYGQSYLDSLNSELLQVKDDTLRVKILGSIAYYYSVNQFDSGISYAIRTMDLAKQINYKFGEFMANRALLFSYNSMANYNKVLEIALANIQVADGIPNHHLTHLATAYTDLGLVNREMQNLTVSVEDYRMALRYQSESGEPLSICWDCFGFYSGLAVIGIQKKNFDSVLYYANLGYKTCVASENSRVALCLSLGILGFTEGVLGLYSEAEQHFREGIASSKKFNIQYLLARLYSNLADLFLKEKKTDSSILYAQLSLAICQKFRYPDYALGASTVLANAYEFEKKSDSALKYLRVALASDSIFSQQKMSQFNAHLSDQREKELKESVAREKYRDKIKVYTLLAALVIFLLIAFILYRNNKQKQRSNRLLTIQKHEIEQQRTKAETTLSELRSTQEQLIQSEKMASLGELTAGIAHEIQNPLNFVNNFSEVSVELMNEMKLEIESGNIPEAAILADTIEQNLNKVVHHGRRADSIVKGMLQHSRTNAGQKGPTDLNVLAEEFLRISYHGLRAKDKDLNINIQTHLDERIGKINLISQDIGRALINLYNNAWYAVNEKKKLLGENYEPMVILSTRALAEKAEIRIRDNGNGIPKKNIEKIYQPFFTTKPTGEGTGLGLSLVYDIVVKEHGGQIKVETQEGTFTEFIIELPSGTD